MDVMVEHAAKLGVREVVIGMAHRGRLNVLANVMQKPVENIFAEFEDMPVDVVQGSGDVKYHLGYSSDAVTSDGNVMHLSLTPNPSHLEAVNPVVEGRVRAKQDLDNKGPRQATMAVLIHGDAAFAGQGVVAETLQLSELPAYRTEGTIHIIVNNQIGFTTGADEGGLRRMQRASRGCWVCLFSMSTGRAPVCGSGDEDCCGMAAALQT